MVLSQTISGIKPGIFYQDLPFYSLYFRDQDRGGDWRDVFLYSTRSPEEDTLILAKQGAASFTSSRKRTTSSSCVDGVIHGFKKKDPDNYAADLLLPRRPKRSATWSPSARTGAARSWSFPSCAANCAKTPGDVLLSLEFHKKFALPFACLALGFLGLSLGISTRKGGKTSGFVISLGIIFIYYVMMTAGRNLILKSIVSPLLGLLGADPFPGG